MISKNMVESLNGQINRELYSAYLYLGMASYAASEGFMGVANWYNIQVKEELTHAQMMYDYVTQQGGRVVLLPIESPPQDFASIKDTFEKTLEHEKAVTSLINKLVDTAKKENDHATEIFLQWFVTEQVEEEANPSEILQKIKITGGEGNNLFMLDTELGKRVFNPPTVSDT